MSQLLEHHHEILDALENNAAVDVVYLDFAKAFDRVDYSVLIKKLRSIGISGRLLKWLADFLMDRKQMVKVCKLLSSEGPVHSGVPQGSSLGPLLFLVLIADIDSCTNHVYVSSFADDTRFLLKIREEQDCSKMQEDLIHVYNWATENNMKFNSKKFELVSFSARLRDLNIINPNDNLFNYPDYYDPEGNIIVSVPKVRDLGVSMTSDGKFNSQIDESFKKGNRYAGWILRVFKTSEPTAMVTLFRALVLPHMEYCCQLWGPTAMGKVRQLEAVQRSFTAKITGITNLNYIGRG